MDRKGYYRPWKGKKDKRHSTNSGIDRGQDGLYHHHQWYQNSATVPNQRNTNLFSPQPQQEGQPWLHQTPESVQLPQTSLYPHRQGAHSNQTITQNQQTVQPQDPRRCTQANWNLPQAIEHTNTQRATQAQQARRKEVRHHPEQIDGQHSRASVSKKKDNTGDFGILFMTSPEELLCSEYCHQITVDYEQKLTKDDFAAKEIIKAITAYMNTSGGVLTILGKHAVHDTDLFEWRRRLSEKLKKTYTHYSDFVNFVHENCAQKVHIITSPSPDMITADYQMYTREDGTNSPVIDATRAKIIMKQTPKPAAVLDLTNLVYNEIVTMRESRNVEFKCWNNKDDKDIIKMLHSERTEKALLAMPNLPTGGHVIIGIQENNMLKKLLIIGQQIQNAALITESIEGVLKSDPKGGARRIWGSEETHLTRGTHWNVSYLPVYNCPNNESRFLIVIEIKHCPGGVFMKKPESYQVTESGEIINLSFEDWQRDICNGHRNKEPNVRQREPNPSSKYPPYTENVECQSEAAYGLNHPEFEANLTIHPPNEPEFESIPSTLEPDSEIYRSKANAESVCSRSQDNIETPTSGICVDQQDDTSVENLQPLPKPALESLGPETNRTNKVLAKAVSVSWAENNKNWKSELESDNIKLESVLPSIEDIMRCCNPVRFVPDIETIVNSASTYREELRSCIHHIEAYHGPHRGVVIASNEWIKLISDGDIPRPGHHVTDFMCMDERCLLRIISLFGKKHSSTESKMRLSYVRQLARLTKRHIILHENCLIDAIYIQTAIWVDHDAFKMTSSLDDWCNTFLSGQPSQWGHLQDTIGMLLLTKSSHTTIRRNIGDECLIKLTMAQMAVILGTDISQFNLIEGPPGSGKTVLALYVTRQYGDKESHILCQNPSLKKYLDFQSGSLKTSNVNNDDDFMTISTSRKFWRGLKCLIIDDCHNYDCKEKTWISFFKKILKENVHCFIFMDNSVQNFRSQQFMPVSKVFLQFSETKHISYQIRKLQKVHRNTQKIVAYIKAGFHTSVTCGHQEEGDDVEIRRVLNLYSPTEVNGLLAIVKELIYGDGTLSAAMCYEKTDIAVLVDGEKYRSNIDLFLEVFKNHFPEFNAQKSHIFPVGGVVVDHVDCFSGLDAKVCILVSTGVDSNTNKFGDRHFSNPKYKAFIASRGTHRVIFVTESPIDSEKVEEMYINQNSVVPNTGSLPDYKSARLSLTYDGRRVEKFHPWYVAVCKTTGHVVVTESYNPKIHILTPDLQHVTVIDWRNRGQDQHLGPGGVAISSKRLVYLSNMGQNQIEVIDLQDRGERVLEIKGSETWLSKPRGLAMDSEDRLYVCDSDNFRILVLTAEGDYVTDFRLRPQTYPGERPPQPLYITVTDDRVAVSDLRGDVHILTPQGVHKHTLMHTDSSGPPVPGRFGRAEGLTYDSHGSLLLADGVWGCSIHVLNVSGEGVCVITDNSVGASRDVCVTADGNILLCDADPDTSITGRLVMFYVPKRLHVSP